MLKILPSQQFLTRTSYLQFSRCSSGSLTEVSVLAQKHYITETPNKKGGRLSSPLLRTGSPSQNTDEALLPTNS